MDLLIRSNGRRSVMEIVGTMTRAKPVTIVAGHLFLGVRFKPGMAAAVLPTAREVATDCIVSLRSNQLQALTSRPLTVGTVAECIGMLEDSLTVDIDASPAQDAINTLVESHGNTCLDELQDLAHLGERQFRRCCIRRTGVPPKVLAKILRFKKVWRELQTANPSALTGLAVEAGFFDQAHMNRDFKELSGLTPTDFRTSQR